MLQELIDNFKAGTGNAARLMSLAAGVGLALLVALVFLCAAAFVFLQQRFGLIEALLAEAGIFFVLAAIGGAFYLARKREAEVRALERQREQELRVLQEAERAQEAAQSTIQSVLTDPVLLAAGLQLVKSVGAKRLVPFLAIAGVAIGFFAARRGGHSPES
jgi:uncharacterized protein YneF (UPF0154 family)